MLSRIASLISIGFLLCTAFFFYPKWEKAETEATISWDVSGYYWYLPALFIYHDVKEQQFADSIIKKYRPTPEIQQSALHDGKRVMTYSAGMAVMYLPAFAVAHVVASPMGYPADGFSYPYQVAIGLWSLLVACIGIWQFRRLLLLYYSDSVAAIVILCLVVGTNYLNYAAIEAAQTHNWLFTIYVLLLLNTHHFYRRPGVKNALGIGVFCGLAILIRPSEIICILLPLLWGMNSLRLAAWKRQFAFLKQRGRHILIVAAIIALIGCIQLAYWKYASGHWLVYSYGEDKGFSWLHPHFYDYMFSARSGWISYTPLAILFFVGIIPFVKYGQNKVAVLAFFLLSLYIVCAWDIWWYGGTGGRAMIQSYPVIMLPFASLVQWLGMRKPRAVVAAPFILVFVYVNIWFTANAHGWPGLYDPEGMTRAYYRAVIGRWHVSPEVAKLKDTRHIYEGVLHRKQLLFSTGYENADTSLGGLSPITGRASAFVDGEHQFSMPAGFRYRGSFEWLHIQATARIGQKEWDTWKMTQMVVRLYFERQEIDAQSLRLQRFMNDGDTKNVYLDVRMPEQVDSVSISFWNADGNKPAQADDVMVWGYYGQ